MLEYCEFLDQQIAGLSYEDLQVISYFTEHYHLIMNQQVIEGKDKFAHSLEHFSSRSYQKVMNSGIFIWILLLARKFLNLNRHILIEKDHETIYLNLVDKFFELIKALFVEIFQLTYVNVSLHIFEIFDLQEEALNDIWLAAELWVYCLEDSIDNC